MTYLRKKLNQIVFSNRYASLVQVAPATLLVLVFFVIPLIQLFLVSLWKYNPTGVLEQTAPTLENYLKFVNQQYYARSILNTLRLGFVTSTICVILGYPLAYIFARYNLRFKGIFMFILITPLFVSVVVRIFGWIVLLERTGVINYTLKAVGLIDEPLSIMRTETAVVIGLVNVLLTFTVMPIYSSILSIKESIEEAASTLGASPIITWLKVTLPLSLPGILAGWTLAFLMTISSYVQPSILGGPAYFVLATVLRTQITGALNWPMAAATGFVLLLVGLLAVRLPVWLLTRAMGSSLEEGVNRG